VGWDGCQARHWASSPSEVAAERRNRDFLSDDFPQCLQLVFLDQSCGSLSASTGKGWHNHPHFACSEHGFECLWAAGIAQAAVEFGC